MLTLVVTVLADPDRPKHEPPYLVEDAVGVPHPRVQRSGAAPPWTRSLVSRVVRFYIYLLTLCIADFLRTPDRQRHARAPSVKGARGVGYL